VSSGTLNLAQSINQSINVRSSGSSDVVNYIWIYQITTFIS